MPSRSYVCKPIALGINTDGYQPLEKRLEVTRGILAVLARCRHPVTIVTKSALVLRDLDLLTDLARDRLVSVMLSITSLTDDIKRTLEPRTASPQARLRVIRELAQAGDSRGRAGRARDSRDHGSRDGGYPRAARARRARAQRAMCSALAA